MACSDEGRASLVQPQKDLALPGFERRVQEMAPHEDLDRRSGGCVE